MSDTLKHYIAFKYKSIKEQDQKEVNLQILQFANVEQVGRYMPGDRYPDWGMVILRRASPDLFSWMQQCDNITDVEIPPDRTMC